MLVRQGKTDEEIAAIFQVSTRTVIRWRKEFQLRKARGGTRPGAGRKKRDDDENIPKPMVRWRKLHISLEKLVIVCRSQYKEERTRKGQQRFKARSRELPNYTVEPRLLRGQY
ncbi:helix-turn-helix domain-containing protein [Heliobacterium chlorum]|uniref:Helix-turn-helix domain-containing protein n=1 Tax=Heliobacterium chlorum TaxID=2698 RepID=A0ABR7T6V1_HELCL|nr:helix-turn-helix domain-containing protein [Heliobacterium chlorum]MBC9785827.1 helix-turn-helix domain-containing protein [Heliobacterium chlorum]